MSQKNSDICPLSIFNKTWCFLILKLANTDPNYVLKSWEIGYNHLNRIANTTVNTLFEKQLVLELLHEIFTHSQQNTIIVTYRKNSIAILRRRILFHNLNNVSLQDIHCISVEEILRNHFLLDPNRTQNTIFDVADQFNITIDNEKSEAELLRVIFQKIIKLIPTGVIEQ